MMMWRTRTRERDGQVWASFDGELWWRAHKWDDRTEFWPELPRSLRIAAEKLRVLTNSPDDWGDLEVAARIIEEMLPPK